MAAPTKITGQSYYNYMPSVDLEVGDVWTGLPTFGHLRRNVCCGVVITPACDLSNRKVETVSYLPVIPIYDYLTSRGFAVELIRVVRGQASVAGLGDLQGWSTRGIELPTHRDIEEVLDKATSNEKSGSEKQKTAASRIGAAARTLLAIRGRGTPNVAAVFAALGEKEKARLLSEICRNSHSPDVHFLPADGRTGSASAMPVHSVVLFRYPMALPVELLDAANDINISDWNAAVTSLIAELPVCANALGSRPIKLATLRPQYLPDLLARFVALHVRMGSPDFSKETITAFVDQLGVAE